MTGHGVIFFKLFITFINRLIAWKKKCNHLYFDAVTILRKLSHTFFCEPGEGRGGDSKPQSYAYKIIENFNLYLMMFLLTSADM